MELVACVLGVRGAGRIQATKVLKIGRSNKRVSSTELAIIQSLFVVSRRSG